MEQALWWVSTAMPLVGVVVGVVLKWAIDVVTENGRRQREDRAQFLHERQAAYYELYRAATKAETLLWASDEMRPMLEHIESLVQQKAPSGIPKDVAASLQGGIAASREAASAFRRALKALEGEVSATVADSAAAYSMANLHAPPEVVAAAGGIRDACAKRDLERLRSSTRDFLMTVRRDLRAPDALT